MLGHADKKATQGTPKGNSPTDEVSQREMERYLSKLSGPLIDRIDIHCEVPAVPFEKLANKSQGTSSATMREHVLRARAVQSKRNGGPRIPNSRLSGRELDRVAVLDNQCREILRQAMDEMGLSARAFDKVRRVSRTIADLDGREQIAINDIAEAIGYRLLDRQM